MPRREAAADAHRRAALGAERRRAAARVRAAVDLADDLEPFAHGARDRDSRRSSTSFWLSPRVGSPRMPRPKLPTNRIDCTVLPTRPLHVEVGRVEAEPALVAGVGQLRREAQAERRIARRFSPTMPDLGGEDDVLDVVGRVAGEVEHGRRAAPDRRRDA